MSGFDKSQDHYEYDYEADASTRPPQDPSYAALAHQTPSFDPQASESHGLPGTHQMPYLGASFVPRDSTSFQPAPTNLTAGGVRDHLHITSLPPHRGIAGEKLHVNFRSQSDYSSEKLFFTLMFAYQASKAALTKSFYQAPYYHYTVTADIPDLDIEGSRMPLMLEVQDENGLTLEQKAMGSFMYDTGGYQQYSTVDDRRKRKISEHPSDYLQSSPKRSASQPLHQSRFKDSSGVYSGHQLSNPSGSPYSPNTLFAVPSAYDRPVQQPRSTYVHPLAQRPSYGYSMSPNLAPQSMKARSPGATTYGSYSALAQNQSPRLSNLQASSAALSRSVSSTSNSNPPLIRTTILKPPPPVPQPSYGASHSFNPYAIYPNSKAVLNIVGDLQSMCENWTKEERRASRRLVEFQRSQIGSTITTTFKAVTPEERSPNNPVVSCINWEKKSQCFVTSVDTIALLEALVGVRFTVEEKNRIRRNLEGFKPYTVAKTKDECDDIFRLIMSFPAPKPRNIEKDIKIFPWSILTSALKKIIGKYSASYASTSSLLNPTSGYGGTVAEAGEHPHPTASPGSTTSSNVPTVYQTGMTSTSLSPSMTVGSAGTNVPGSAQDLRSSSLSHYVTPGASHLGQWQTPQYHSQYGPGVAVPSEGRSSWDMTAFLEPSTATGNAPSAGSGQPLAYYRTTTERPSEQTPDLGTQQQPQPDSYPSQSQQQHHQTSRP